VADRLLVSVPIACRLAAEPPLGRDFGYQLVRTGAWKSVRVGRRTLVVVASIHEWVEREAARSLPEAT
jgi:hypothetical protein